MNPLNKILLGLGVAIFGVIIITFVWLSLANAHLKTALAQAQGDNALCRIANNDFVAKVEQQNKAVEALRQAGLARKKQAQQATYEAQKTIRAYTLAADKLRQTRTSGDECVAAHDLFRRYLEAK